MAPPATDLFLGTERPALLVNGPEALVPEDGSRLSPMTKLWAGAGGLAVATVGLALLTAWYWRRTRPMIAAHSANAGSLSARDEPAPRPSSGITDRRTPAGTSVPPPRWTGEVKVTSTPLTVGSLVPTSVRSTGGPAARPARRWTGDRWADCESRDNESVSAGHPQ